MPRTATRYGIVALAAVTALTLSSCSSGGQQERGDTDGGETDFTPITLTYADFNAPQGAIADAMAAWQQEVTEATGGAVTFENYYSASLLGTADMLTGLQGGVADIGLVFPTYYPQDLPVSAWLQGMNAYSSISPMRSMGVGTAAASIASLGDGPIRAEFESAGLQPLVTVSTAAYNLTCTDPIETPQETAGKRSRTSGPVWSQAVESLGMTVVDLPYNDMYEGLQRGILDCAAISAAAIDTGGFGEVANYVSPVALPSITSFWTFNKARWDALQPEVRAIMHDALDTYVGVLLQGYLDSTQVAFDNFTSEDSPVQLQDASEVQPVVDAAREEYIDALVSTAPEGLDDPESVVGAYRDQIEQWDALMTELGYAEASTGIADVIEEASTLSETDLQPFLTAYKDKVLAQTAPE